MIAHQIGPLDEGTVDEKTYPVARASSDKQGDDEYLLHLGHGLEQVEEKTVDCIKEWGAIRSTKGGEIGL